MIADVVTSTGISIYIISKYGIQFKSKLFVEKKNNSLWEPRLYWRMNPKLGCEFSFIKNISKTGDEVNLIFPDMKISFEVFFIWNMGSHTYLISSNVPLLLFLSCYAGCRFH